MTVFLATAHNGKLDFGSDINQARLHDFLVKNEGKTLRVELPKTVRSSQQNRLYWAYLGIIEQDTGNFSEDLHLFFKEKLLPKKAITIKGHKGEYELMKPVSTTELSKADFGEYMMKINAMTGIPVPDPRDLGIITNY